MFGQRLRHFDYELLLDVVKKIPKDVGESFFWDTIDKTDFNIVAEKWNRRTELRLMRQFKADTRKELRLKRTRLRPSKSGTNK